MSTRLDRLRARTASLPSGFDQAGEGAGRASSRHAALAAPASARVEAAAFLIALAANLILALKARQFPLEDSTNHLVRYVFLDRAWLGGHGTLPPYIETHLVVGPYLGFDLVGAVLVHLLGPAAALRAIAVIVVCALPIGHWLLLRAVGGDNRAWSLAAVLLSTGFFTVVGFVSYVAGVGAALAWLAAWWRVRARPSPSRLVGLWLGAVGLYLLHLSAALIVLIVVWLDYVVPLLLPNLASGDVASPAGIDASSASVPAAEDRPGVDRWGRRLSRDRRLWLALGATAAVAIAVARGGVGTAHPGSNGVALDYPSLAVKLRNVASPFYVFSYRQAIVGIVVYTLIAAVFLRTNWAALRRPARWGVFGIAAIVSLVLYLVFPRGTPGTGYLDIRWLPPALLFPFAAAGPAGRPPARGLLALMLAGCLVHDAVLWPSLRAIDRELADYSAILRQIPPGQRVLPIVADEYRHGQRVFPYRHYVFWYVIDRDGRAPALFNGNGAGGGRPVLTFLRHFVERDHLYDPGDSWGVKVFTRLDWRRVRRDFDYIVEAGQDPRAEHQIAGHARELSRVGDVSLYRLRGAP